MPIEIDQRNVIELIDQDVINNNDIVISDSNILLMQIEQLIKQSNLTIDNLIKLQQNQNITLEDIKDIIQYVYDSAVKIEQHIDKDINEIVNVVITTYMDLDAKLGEQVSPSYSELIDTINDIRDKLEKLVDIFSEYINQTNTNKAINSRDNRQVIDYITSNKQNITENILNKIETHDENISDIYLSTSCYELINRMTNGESIMRIADIVYGDDSDTTVTGIYYVGKNSINMLRTIRTDLAVTMSSSFPTETPIQIELIVNVNKFNTHIQKLVIINDTVPVVPILNPIVAALLQPIMHNKHIYKAYGYDSDKIVENKASRREIMQALSGTPVHVTIDRLVMNYVGPRDIRILLTISRVLTVNSFNDRVLYCRTLEGALLQQQYLRQLQIGQKDDDAIKIYANAFGLYTKESDRMIEALGQFPKYTGENTAPFKATVVHVPDGDTVEIVYTDAFNRTIRKDVRVLGIDAPDTTSLKEFAAHDRNEIVAQPYAEEARHYLMQLIQRTNNKIIVKPTNIIDSSGLNRIIGEIFLDNEEQTNLGLEMVRQGYAFANPTHFTAEMSNSFNSLNLSEKDMVKQLYQYQEAQKYAKSKKLNIWSQPIEKIVYPKAHRNAVNRKNSKRIK